MKLTTEQKKITGAILKGDSVCIYAYAGCAKTTTLVEAFKRYAIKGQRGLVVAFNVRIKKELEKKLDGTGWEVKTLNGLGHSTLLANSGMWNGGKGLTLIHDKERRIVMEMMDTKVALSQVYQALSSKDKSTAVAVNRDDIIDQLTSSLNWCKVYGITPGMVTPSIAAKALEEASLLLERTNLFQSRESIPLSRILKHMLNRDVQVARDRGIIDYADQIWLAVNFCKHQGRKWDVVAVDEAQDLSSQNHKQVIAACKKQMIIVGDPNQCQPAGTKVLTPDGKLVNIENIKKGDGFTTYSWRNSHIYGKNSGMIDQWGYFRPNENIPRVLDVAKRKYSGPMLKIRTENGLVTRCTPEHKWPVKVDLNAKLYYVYLMKKKNHIRMGMTSNPIQRCRGEGADQLWVLKAFHSREDAIFYENVMSAKYGIPQIVFSATREERHKEGLMGKKEYRKWKKSKQAMLDSAWKAIGKNSHKLKQVLEDHGRLEAYPYFSLKSGKRDSWLVETDKKVAIVRACNLIPGRHLLCSPLAKQKGKNTQKTKWNHFEMTARKFKGYVYSLDVEKKWDCEKVYIADGLVTHNSIYGFRGATDDSMSLLQDTWKPEAKVLTLSQTFRCSKVVVERQRAIIKNAKKFKAFKTNKVGDVHMPFVSRRRGRRYFWSVSGMFKRMESIKAHKAFVIAAHNSFCYAFIGVALSEGVTPEYLSFTGQSPSKEDILKAFQTNSYKDLTPKQRGLLLTRKLNIEIQTPEDLAMVFSKYRVEDTGDASSSKAPMVVGTCHSMKGLEAEAVWLLHPETLGDTGNLRYVAETRTANFLGSLYFEHHRWVKEYKTFCAYAKKTYDGAAEKINVGVKPKTLITSQLKNVPVMYRQDEAIIRRRYRKGPTSQVEIVSGVVKPK
jgi:hypothetical protein